MSTGDRKPLQAHRCRRAGNGTDLGAATTSSRKASSLSSSSAVLTVASGRSVQLARRAAADLPGLGDERAGQLLCHRGPGIGRHQRVRELRAAVQHRGDGIAVGPARAAEMVRRHAPGRRRQRLRDHARCAARPQSGRRHGRAGGLGCRERRPADRWATDYDTALTDAGGDPTQVAEGDYGPVPVLAQGLPTWPPPGALDGDPDRPGRLLPDRLHQADPVPRRRLLPRRRRDRRHLQGNTWGMMNETGSYPGQAWLWLYSFWYQIPQFNSDNPTTT